MHQHQSAAPRSTRQRRRLQSTPTTTRTPTTTSSRTSARGTRSRWSTARSSLRHTAHATAQERGRSDVDGIVVRPPDWERRPSPLSPWHDPDSATWALTTPSGPGRARGCRLWETTSSAVEEACKGGHRGDGTHVRSQPCHDGDRQVGLGSHLGLGSMRLTCRTPGSSMLEAPEVTSSDRNAEWNAAATASVEAAIPAAGLDGGLSTTSILPPPTTTTSTESNARDPERRNSTCSTTRTTTATPPRIRHYARALGDTGSDDYVDHPPSEPSRRSGGRPTNR